METPWQEIQHGKLTSPANDDVQITITSPQFDASNSSLRQNGTRKTSVFGYWIGLIKGKS